MNVTYSDKVTQQGKVMSLLQALTEQLEEVLGHFVDQVRVEWDCTEDDKGRPLFLLRLSDWSGSVSTSFSLDEVQNPTQMWISLRLLWGKLLQVRNEKQLKELQAIED